MLGILSSAINNRETDVVATEPVELLNSSNLPQAATDVRCPPNHQHLGLLPEMMVLATYRWTRSAQLQVGGAQAA